MDPAESPNKALDGYLWYRNTNGMPMRRNRSEQNAAVRSELLAAARHQFLAHGYHGTTVERVAEMAGFTKGAVYSRFESKGELFLALLEERISARAAQNKALAASVEGTEGLTELLHRWSEIEQDDEPWTMLVVEFRAHASRDPDLGRRYGELHSRTVAGVQAVVEQVLGDADPGIARLILALGVGSALERAVDRDAIAGRHIDAFVAALAVTKGDPNDG